MESTAYVVCQKLKYTYHFTGVTAIEHNLALNIGNDASQGGDIINGARNLPDQVTLSVIETDAVRGAGGSARMLEAMASLKKNRYLCKVVTAMGTYKNMLLTEITAAEDEENPCGWTGSLAFMKYVPASSSSSSSGSSFSVRKTSNNSSTKKNTGTKAAAAVVAGAANSVGSALQAVLQRAGIKS